MANNILYPQVNIAIKSSTNEFSMIYDNSVSASDKLMTDGFVGLSTSNDLSQDSAAFSIMLAGDFRWDYVINENDIIIIQANPQAGTLDSTIGDSGSSTIFVGMVSEVHIVGDFNSPSFYYQISGKSMAKMFSSYKIGLVQEAQNELTNMGWLWDINADYEGSEGDSGGSDSDGGSNTGAISKEDFKKAAKKAAKITKKEKLTDADIDQLYSQAFFESGVREDPPGGYDDHDNTGIPRGMFQYKLSTWNSWKWSDKYSNILKMKDQFLAVFNDSTWRKDFPPTGVRRGWTPHGKKLNDGGSPNKDGSSDSGDSDSGSGSGSGTGLSSEQISKEKDGTTGVAFMGNAVWAIENEIVERFKPYMRISYNNGANTVFDYLDYTGLTSWDDDEILTDSTQYTSFDGSLLELMDAIRVQPFNEFFFEATSDAKGKMVVRRTPFEQDDWNKLTTIKVDSSALVSTDIAKSDDEAYSIFNVNPDTYGLFSISANGGLLSSYPQYHPALVNVYGYSKMEVTNQYLTGQPTKTDDMDQDLDKDDTNGATHGKHYGLAGVNAYLGGIDHDELRKNPGAYSQKLTNKADNISPTEAVALVQSYMNTGWIVTEVHWNSIMHIDTNGGLSNTGTESTTLGNVKKYLKKATDLATFTKLGKANLRNVDDEELASIWNTWVGNKKKLSQKELTKIIKETKSTNSSTSSTQADSLKRFTMRLYDWYCENPNFYAGDVTVIGHSAYRVGDRLLLYMNNYNDTFEFYVESVKHNISFSDGWTTTLGVTRGLPQSGQTRYTNLWGQSLDFVGGLMGEAKFQNMAFESEDSDSSSSSSSGGSTKKGNKAMKAAVKMAEDWIAKKGQGSIPYVFGGGRGNVDPWSGNGHPADCSSSMAWLYKDVGCPLVDIGSCTTWSIMGASTVSRVAGSSPSEVWANLKEGDLVFWSIGEPQGHMGMYVGNNMCIADNTSTGIQKFDASTSYWMGHFKGDAVRPK